MNKEHGPLFAVDELPTELSQLLLDAEVAFHQVARDGQERAAFGRPRSQKISEMSIECEMKVHFFLGLGLFSSSMSPVEGVSLMPRSSSGKPSISRISGRTTAPATLSTNGANDCFFIVEAAVR